jgi:hypothetical protein
MKNRTIKYKLCDIIANSYNKFGVYIYGSEINKLCKLTQIRIYMIKKKKKKRYLDMTWKKKNKKIKKKKKGKNNK